MKRIKLQKSKEIFDHRVLESQIGMQHSIPKDCTILIVEDIVSNFVLISSILGSLGVNCEWKTSGYEVAEYTNSLPRLHLILIDMLLPYDDCFSVVKILRASDQFNDVPIIAMAAESSMDQMSKAREFGFDGFLGKPIDPDRFTIQIQKILCGEPVWELN
jgi:two-component system, cell cycle response regulator DivK